jgi:hypothetical protein
MLPDLPKTVVLGLGHKARHGKDTVAAMLVPVLEAAGFRARRYSFASALYDHCRTQHGMTTKDAALLQRVGVEARERDVLTWVRAVAWKIADEAPDIAIVTDVRFRNEADLVRGTYRGLTCRVRRTVHGLPFIDPARDASHVSETDLDGYAWDRAIDNAGAIEDLRGDVLQLAGTLARMRQGRAA